MTGIGGHHSPYQGATNDWLTPPDIIEALGPFDLDPCASVNQPWRTADVQYTQHGLEQLWDGFVWCNPPYGPETWTWLEQMSQHDNGIALTFARTETKGFFSQVWRGTADSMLFLEGRLFFHHPVTGERAAHNSGGPSVLLAYGEKATTRLVTSGLKGALIRDWEVQT